MAVNVQVRMHAVAPDWPHTALDVGALVAQGWRPQPFIEFVVKLHGRCNLACDYCYMYARADQSWRRRPARMSEATMFRTAERVAEHAEAHGLSQVEVVLHGGEPLLAGPRAVGFLARAVRTSLPPGTRLRLSLQTNGTLLDDRILGTLDAHDIRVGVSLDGVAAHDAHRRRAAGGGSHDRIVDSLRRLRSPRFRHLFAGLLCVVDIQYDAVRTYESLLAHEPPAMDFLLPHATWADPPFRPGGSGSTPYGDWLAAVFDRWYGAAERETSVRLFDEVLRMLLGRPGRLESIGLAPVRLVLVDTDGAIEQVDALRSAYEGAASTGLNVHREPFDAALYHPPVVARQIGVDALAAECRRCTVHQVCGGGYYPHRYRPGTGFRHPSVYCGDLSRFIRHAHRRLADDLDGSGPTPVP